MIPLANAKLKRTQNSFHRSSSIQNKTRSNVSNSHAGRQSHHISIDCQLTFSISLPSGSEETNGNNIMEIFRLKWSSGAGTVACSLRNILKRWRRCVRNWISLMITFCKVAFDPPDFDSHLRQVTALSCQLCRSA